MDSSTKKTVLIVIVSLAAVLLLAATGFYFYFKSQFIVYEDSQYKFSIEYPRTWRIIIHPKPNVAVVFLRPKDTALDAMQENFNVTVQPTSDQDHNLDTFNANVRKQMLAVFGKSINIAEDTPLHWGWREGHKMAFEAPTPDHLKMVTAWVLRVDQAYIMTFLGDMYKYNQDYLYVTEMIRSLQLQ